MMKNATISAIFALLAGGGHFTQGVKPWESPAANDRVIQVPSELIPYVDSFEAQAEMRLKRTFKIERLIVRMVVKLKNGEPNWVGTCEFSDPPVVEILMSWWNKSTHSERENLMFHELGHCILGQQHRGTDYNFPPSIMNAVMMPVKLYNERTREEMLSELFEYQDYEPRHNRCEMRVK